MKILKPIAAAAVGLSIGIGGSSAAFAKGHDQGAADGKRGELILRNPGDVAGLDVIGVGFDGETFLGVAADLNSDLNYGQNVVRVQAARGTRRVVPVVNGRN